MRTGAHVSIKGSFTEAAERARDLGCTAFQIFAGSPRSFAREMPAPADAEGFRSIVDAHDMRPVVVHAGYMLHLISPKKSVAGGARELLRKELEVARELSAEYYVLHPGSAAGRPVDEVIDMLVSAIRSVDVPGPMILIENTASLKTGTGSRFEDLASILDKLGDDSRYGVTFDTAHATGAGYDLSSASAVKKSLSELYRHVGRERIRVIHANDSKADVGTGRDLHEHIGEGAVGSAGFRAILADRTMSTLPFIVETPADTPEDHLRDMRALQALARAKASGRKK